MLAPFESLSKQSRLWVYQANRKLTGGEHATIMEVMNKFCEQWAAHGNPLKASFKIDYDQFLILAVDEAWSGASGCSIDGSVKALKSIAQQLGLDFFDRTNAAFLVKDSVVLIPLKDLKKSVASGIITGATLAFNTLVATVDELNRQWLLPMDATWLSRYIPSN